MLVRGRSRPARPLREQLASFNRYLSLTNAKTAPQQAPGPESPGGGGARPAGHVPIRARYETGPIRPGAVRKSGPLWNTQTVEGM